MQPFMSNWPWRGEAVMEAVQSQVRSHREFQTDALVIFDESADAKSGETSAGAGRQQHGRLGKVAPRGHPSQVGVFAAWVRPHVNTWIDGELYLPPAWFGAEAVERRAKGGIPPERSFQTKPELVWTLVQRIGANGVPFVAVAMDDLYGRHPPLRQRLDQADIES
jgi:SRSO17 transposase